jgi:hypothetical protein
VLYRCAHTDVKTERWDQVRDLCSEEEWASIKQDLVIYVLKQEASNVRAKIELLMKDGLYAQCITIFPSPSGEAGEMELLEQRAVGGRQAWRSVTGLTFTFVSLGQLVPLQLQLALKTVIMAATGTTNIALEENNSTLCLNFEYEQQWMTCKNVKINIGTSSTVFFSSHTK